MVAKASCHGAHEQCNHEKDEISGSIADLRKESPATFILSPLLARLSHNGGEVLVILYIICSKRMCNAKRVSERSLKYNRPS
jgi:hypothetical protein